MTNYAKVCYRCYKKGNCPSERTDIHSCDAFEITEPYSLPAPCGQHEDIKEEIVQLKEISD